MNIWEDAETAKHAFEANKRLLLGIHCQTGEQTFYALPVGSQPVVDEEGGLLRFEYRLRSTNKFNIIVEWKHPVDGLHYLVGQYNPYQ